MSLEQVPDTFPSLFYGYLVIWAIFGIYLLTLGFRVSKLERD